MHYSLQHLPIFNTWSTFFYPFMFLLNAKNIHRLADITQIYLPKRFNSDLNTVKVFQNYIQDRKKRI